MNFKITNCGCEGYYDESEESETEDIGIENENTLSINLNSSKRNICYEINWI